MNKVTLKNKSEFFDNRRNRYYCSVHTMHTKETGGAEWHKPYLQDLRKLFESAIKEAVEAERGKFRSILIDWRLRYPKYLDDEEAEYIAQSKMARHLLDKLMEDLDELSQ